MIIIMVWLNKLLMVMEKIEMMAKLTRNKLMIVDLSEPGR